MILGTEIVQNLGNINFSHIGGHLSLGGFVVRMTNTGVTSVLYPDGGQSQYLGVYQRDFLDIELNTKKVMEKTFFQKMGNLPLLIIFGFLIIVKFIIFRKKHILV